VWLTPTLVCWYQAAKGFEWAANIPALTLTQGLRLAFSKDTHLLLAEFANHHGPIFQIKFVVKQISIFFSSCGDLSLYFNQFGTVLILIYFTNKCCVTSKKPEVAPVGLTSAYGFSRQEPRWRSAYAGGD
jgi:hypothetical protein